MADARRFRVLGALGPGRFAPLLAEQTGPGPLVRRVVLHRPAANPDASRLGLLGGGRVVTDEDRVRTPDDERSLTSWSPGADLEALVDAHPGGLSGPVAREIAYQVALALQEARSGRGGAPEMGHGALAGDKIRVRPDGVVVVHGFAGGAEAGDVAALIDLLDEWRGDAPEPVARAHAIDALLAALRGAERADLGAWIGARGLPESTLHEHPLVGAEWEQAGAPPPATSPKVQAARFGATTLLLGLAAGAMFGRAFPAATELEVPAAQQLRITCEHVVIEAAGPSVVLPPVSGRCSVVARDTQRAELRGTLDIHGPGRYRCHARDGVLTCSDR